VNQRNGHANQASKDLSVMPRTSPTNNDRGMNPTRTTTSTRVAIRVVR
jgi:hypothetical protein